MDKDIKMFLFAFVGIVILMGITAILM